MTITVSEIVAPALFYFVVDFVGKLGNVGKRLEAGKPISYARVVSQVGVIENVKLPFVAGEKGF